MKNLIVLSTLVFSLTAFAQENSFRTLNCQVEHPYPSPAEKNFSLIMRFHQRLSAVNDSGLDKHHKADLIVTRGKFTTSMKDVPVGQATSAYGYEISINRRLFGSAYSSYISIHPNFKGLFTKKLVDFTGITEINAMVNGSDDMLAKTEYLRCRVVD